MHLLCVTETCIAARELCIFRAQLRLRIFYFTEIYIKNLSNTVICHINRKAVQYWKIVKYNISNAVVEDFDKYILYKHIKGETL